MPRTLIVATTSFAGMGPYVSEIVNNFTDKDDIYCFFYEYEDDFFFKNINKEMHNKSVFFKYPNSKWNKVKSLLPLKNVAHNHIIEYCKKKNIQLVHFINNPGPKGIVRDLKKNGIAVVSTVHDLHPHESKKAWYKELRFKILYKRLHDNLIFAKDFITNSKTQYNELVERYPEKNVYFHSFPSLVSKEIANGCDFPKELQGRSRPYILFFGRIEEYKGISLLYKAFMETKDLHQQFDLVIAGSGTLPFTIEQKTNNIILINRYINDSEVAELYKNARVVVYPYISATQSGVLSIAFYFKTPVLMSDVPFFKETVADSGAGRIFKANDSEDLEKKLLELLKENPNIIGDAERNFYDANYDRAAVRKSLLNIYEKVYAGRHIK